MTITSVTDKWIAKSLLILCFPIILPAGVIFMGASFAVEYFSPDIETAIVERYKRPVVGLKLCGACKVLKYGLPKIKVTHHPDEVALKHSALEGCRCCQMVLRELEIAKEHCNVLPDVQDPFEFRIPRYLLWFVDHTQTRTGYLDGFRGKRYYQYIRSQQPRPLLDDPSSKACFDLIRGWIGTCDQYDQCYQGQNIPLPTRVIDVSKGEPYLLESNGLHGQYMTLSHCWGSAKPLITTISTLDARKSSIPGGTLPKMFQDAILIARQLGINYIWIDSLCIIQDSEEDWARESAVMGSIYRFAYLTLSALDAIGSQDSILTPRLQNCDVGMKEVGLNSVELQTPLKSRRDAFKQSSLCSRAWALQERLLSPRVLYYNKTEVLWECLECTAREGSTTVKLYRPSVYSYADYHCPDVKNRLIKPLSVEEFLPPAPPLDWHIIVAEYTRCNVTRATDRLPALSGLASIYQANTGHAYLGGLWTETLGNDLLWFSQPSQPRTFTLSEPTYLGPSWSWVSCPFPVFYIALTGSETSPVESTSDIELVDSKITLRGSNPMGEITDAWITVQALSAPLFIEELPSSETLYLSNSQGTRVGTFLPDADGDMLTSKRECTVLWITQRKYMAHNYDRNTAVSSSWYMWTYLLVIEPDSTGNSWRRIGLGKSTKGRQIFESTETKSTFRIV